MELRPLRIEHRETIAYVFNFESIVNTQLFEQLSNVNLQIVDVGVVIVPKRLHISESVDAQNQPVEANAMRVNLEGASGARDQRKKLAR